MELNEGEICADFDRRVHEGIVVFHGYRTITHSDNGFELEFRLLSGLAHKPMVPGEKLTPRPTSGLRPGSDIDVSGYEVANLGLTHILAFNKFSAARPHLLILTQDGYRRQHEALDESDIGALWQVLSSFGQRRYLAIFNCGIDSGCSRLHKHMQIFPAPELDAFVLWPDVGDASALPFRSFLHRFEDGFPSAQGLVRIYRDLLHKAEDALGRQFGGRNDEAIPHNVVLDSKWMLVIPRRKAGLNGVVANAAAALGMVWVANEEQLGAWKEQGPANIMAHVGIPSATHGEGTGTN